jgi:hypothetical protein
MRIFPFTLFAALAFTLPAQVLFTPSAASTTLYFAQFADGGAATQKWTTTLVLVNPGTTGATVTVNFFTDSGAALALDFGSGARTSLSLTLAAGASASYTSSGAASSTVVGWAMANSDTPILGTLLYQARTNGTAVWDVSATGTGPTHYYGSFANPTLGIALVNPSATATSNLLLTVRNASGTSVATKIFTLAPHAHTAFTLGSQITSLAASFTGSIAITSNDATPLPFVAWTLNGRDGLVASLPQGEFAAPPPAERRAWDALARLKAAIIPLVAEAATVPNTFKKVSADQTLQYFAQVGLAIETTPTIKANYSTSDKKIHISQMTLDMLGSNESALAFLLMRTAVVGFTSTYGLTIDMGVSGDNAEIVADIYAAATLMKAGYDYGAGPDCIARFWSAYLAGLSVDTDIRNAFGIPNSVASIMQALSSFAPNGCAALSSVGISAECMAAHNLWHAHFPSTVP